MKTFSFNEDGTISYQQGYEPYDITEHEYGVLAVERPKYNGKHSKKAKKPQIDYTTRTGIEALLHQLKREGVPILEKTIKRYLSLISPLYHEYFKRKVDEINQRYTY